MHFIFGASGGGGSDAPSLTNSDVTTGTATTASLITAAQARLAAETWGSPNAAIVPVAYMIATTDNGFDGYTVGSSYDSSGYPVVIDLSAPYDSMWIRGNTDNDGGTGGAFALYVVATGEKITADIPFDETPFEVQCTDWADLSAAAKLLTDARLEPRISVEAGTGSSTPDLTTTYLHVYYGSPDAGNFVFGQTASTVCEGDDDRIPDADEEAFLGTISQSGDNFTITPPNSGTVTIVGHVTIRGALTITDGVDSLVLTPTTVI